MDVERVDRGDVAAGGDPPEVELDNADAVYEYYRTHRQPVVAAKGAYALLDLRYRPRVRFSSGARRAVRDLVRSGRPVVVVANHLTHSDQYVLAATAWRTPLRRVIGYTRVLAKDELFVDPAQRRKIDVMGGIPVFRGKDHGLRVVADAGRRMMDVSAERISRGDSLAIFPEGTCNEGDPARVQSIGSGVGHIVARAVARGADPALLAIGICYGPETRIRSASVHVAVPDLTLPGKPMEVARFARERLQSAVDAAVAAY